MAKRKVDVGVYLGKTSIECMEELVLKGDFASSKINEEWLREPTPQKETTTHASGNIEELMVGDMICIRPPEVERGNLSIEDYRKARKIHNKEMEAFHARRKLWGRFEGVPQEVHVGRWTEADPAPFTYTTRLGKSNKYLQVNVGDTGMSISDEVIINDHMDLMAQMHLGPGEHRRASPKYNKHATRETYEVDKRVLRRKYLNAKSDWQMAVANGDDDVDELYEIYIDAKAKYESGIEMIRDLDAGQLSLFNCPTSAPKRARSIPDELLESFELRPNQYLEGAFLSGVVSDWQLFQLRKRAGLPAKLQY